MITVREPRFSPRTRMLPISASGRKATDHSGHGRAVTIDVAPISWFDLDLNPGVDNVKIIQQADTNQIGMIDFNP